MTETSVAMAAFALEMVSDGVIYLAGGLISYANSSAKSILRKSDLLGNANAS